MATSARKAGTCALRLAALTAVLRFVAAPPKYQVKSLSDFDHTVGQWLADGADIEHCIRAHRSTHSAGEVLESVLRLLSLETGKEMQRDLVAAALVERSVA